MNKKKDIAILIMAAGSSSRMGTPKQLLVWKDDTLIECVIDTVLDVQALKPVVVLGANLKLIHQKVEILPVDLICNKQWKRGLGNSIAYGVRHVQKINDVQGLLLVLGDQPLITVSHLKTMISKFEKDKGQIVATQYQNEKIGVPVLFDKVYFNELSILDGDNGAKAILQKHKQHVKLIDGSHLVADIDTKEDYEKLKDN